MKKVELVILDIRKHHVVVSVEDDWDTASDSQSWAALLPLNWREGTERKIERHQVLQSVSPVEPEVRS